MRQYCVTIPMGKRLIGMGMVLHPDIKRVLQGGTLVIIAGTTNGYVAEEILASIGQAEGFSRVGFRRSIPVPPGAKVRKADLMGDVIIRDGQWQKGKTIFDVTDDLQTGDIILKGANALDGFGQSAVFVQHPQGGTILAALRAVIGGRARLIVPVSLEKRVFEDVNILAHQCLAPGAEGLRLMPIPGEAFTEIDAIKWMTGADTSLLAAGGIYGAEGALWLGISGSEEQTQAAADLIKSLSNEPPCLV